MLLLLLACAPEPETDKASEPEETTDTAVDTYSDCVPEAERCNGRDDDCDGLVDEEGGLDWYPDADGDGYGDASAAAVVACERPDGHVASHTDCDDADGARSPGLPEDCTTSVDDDCDGTLNGTDGTGCTIWYRDGDRDGVGGTVSACWCEPTETYDATATGDCDDTDAELVAACPRWSVPTNAAGDLDGDGQEDLAIQTSEGDYLVAVTDEAIQLVEDALIASTSDYGASADLDGDGVAEVVTVGVEDGTSVEYATTIGTATVHPGPVSGELVEGEATFLTGPLYDDGYDLYDPRATALDDVDGDGLDDIVFMTAAMLQQEGPWILPHDTPGSTSLEAVPPLIELPSDVMATCDLTGDGSVELIASSAHAYVFEGPVPRDAHLGLADVDGSWEGLAVGTGCRDVDGDGFLDALGFQWDEDRFVVLRGPTVSDAPEVWATIRVTGSHWGTLADVTGDGSTDVLLATPDRDRVDGGLFVFEHLPSGTFDRADATAHHAGDTPDDGFGYGLVTLPDRDGDGAEDVAVGSDVGVYVFPTL